MKLRTLIIDDEKFALEKLQTYVERTPVLELIAKCSGTTEAMSVLTDQEVDVIFTDIDMPDIDGVRFIESLSCRPYVVFITAYRDFAVDGFRLGATDYLLKPYDFADFQKSVAKVTEAYKKDHPVMPQPEENSLFIKIEHKFVRLDMNSIRYVKSFGEYLQIFVDGVRSPYLTLGSFGDIMRRLNRNFIQVHRSYAVNMNKIQQIEKNHIIMDEETSIPVSDSYRQDFIAYLQNRSFGKLPK